MLRLMAFSFFCWCCTKAYSILTTKKKTINYRPGPGHTVCVG